MLIFWFKRFGNKNQIIQNFNTASAKLERRFFWKIAVGGQRLPHWGKTKRPYGLRGELARSLIRAYGICMECWTDRKNCIGTINFPVEIIITPYQNVWKKPWRAWRSWRKNSMTYIGEESAQIWFPEDRGIYRCWWGLPLLDHTFNGTQRSFFLNAHRKVV